MERLIQLFRRWSGSEPLQTTPLTGAGSNRKYFRLVLSVPVADEPSGGEIRSVIGCIGTSSEENHAFITLARHFSGAGLPVPRVLAATDDEMVYLQTDLGGTSLFDALRQGREAGGNFSAGERSLLRQAIRLLPRVQFAGARGLDFSVCYPQPEFDETNVMFDLNYFKYCFLKATGTDFHELRLEEEFRRMAKELTADSGPAAFMYRDFQARNVMVGAPHPSLFLIDFQGGRRGPCYYDVASFLWQASARYPDELRRQLIDEYYEAASEYTELPPRPVFDERLQRFVLFRLLQVLGAYGFRGYFERKQHFIDSIPPALESIGKVISEDNGYPYLSRLLSGLCAREAHNTSTSHETECRPSQQDNESPRLEVRIFSFSYKKGIPGDESGNGGGYVFDCRGTHNPGRYEPYKKLTGLDKPVTDFLEEDGEILSFLQNIYPLAERHVQRYIQRGFTSLMFSFGCTGGQHRSVYSAQHLAEHLHGCFPEIRIVLCHREQGIRTIFE